MEFLVDRTPKSLSDCIRRIRNASAGFCQSWHARKLNDALATSKEAFEMLDHLQNELLRHRDELQHRSSWAGSAFKSAMESIVGEIVSSPTALQIEAFERLPPGNGALPTGSVPVPLGLAQALNKLKHRASSAGNFMIDSDSRHTLFVFTRAGAGQPDSISRLDVTPFCDAASLAESSRFGPKQDVRS